MTPITFVQKPTMSSREIAELTDKEHKNVLADIRKMLDELKIDTAEVSAVYKADNGQTYKWKPLKRYCDVRSIEIEKVTHPGLPVKVNAYPAEAWRYCYQIDLAKLFGAGK